MISESVMLRFSGRTKVLAVPTLFSRTEKVEIERNVPYNENNTKKGRHIDEKDKYFIGYYFMYRSGRVYFRGKGCNRQFREAFGIAEKSKCAGKRKYGT